jgi:hypothetical protein
MIANPHHSSATVDHYTPLRIVDAARTLMGGITLDPASCALANETVRAGAYYDIEANGLALPWRGSVFLNPPGGTLDASLRLKKNGSLSATKVWWRKLVREWQSGRVEQAIFETKLRTIFVSNDLHGTRPKGSGRRWRRGKCVPDAGWGSKSMCG